MKKILYLLLLVTFGINAQVSTGNEFYSDYGFKSDPTQLQVPASVNYLGTVGTDGTFGKIAPINVNIPYTPVNYSSPTQTIGNHLLGIDTRLGQISSTSAGLTQRVDFTADNITVNSVVYFASSLSGKGSTASGSPPALVLPDNTKAFFTKDVISIAQPSPTIGYAGTYSGNLTVSATPTPVSTQQRFTVEIYRTDNLGAPIASGVSGAPVGDLGVTVLAILDSGIINLTAGSITNIPVSGRLTQNVTINTGERLRYHVSAAKIGTGGGSVTFGVYYGTSYNSYYDIPVAITTDAVLDRSDIPSAITSTDALNYLNTSINSIGDYSSLKPAVTITNDGLYNAFPGVEKASNGDLITVYRKGVTHLTFDGSIRLKRSIDNGFTWGSESTIITGASHDYRDPSLTRLANGNLIMSYFDRISPTNILIYTSISTDNGNTFGTPVQLTGYADYGAVSSKVIQLANGNLLLATYGKSGANGLLNIFRSTNNGTSWSILSTISTDVFGSALKYTEPSLVLLANGNVVATVRNDSTVMVARAVSTDSGATWSSVVDKFSGNSRAQMFMSGSNMITTYRGADGNSYLRISTDEGVNFGNSVKLTSNEVGEQNEYSAMVEIKSKTIAYVYSNQNSAGTSAYIKLRYLNDPISLGDIPYFQTEGLNSTGSSSVAGSLYNNNILGLSGLDVNISTNTSNTASGINIKTGNTDRINILGTGFVGFGKPVPTQVIDVVGNGAFTGFVSVPLVNTQQVRSNSSSGILKVVGGATNYGGSIDVIGTSFGSNNGGINFRTGLAVGESPVVASFNSSGLFNVVGNITASSYSGGATLTGNPTAPTPTAGDNDTSIATTAFVNNVATSGVYTPTSSSLVNTSSPAINSSTYTSLGGIISAMVTLGITTTTLNTNSSITITLPVARSLSSLKYIGHGVFYNADTPAKYIPATIRTTTTNTAIIEFTSPVSGAQILNGSLSFQYQL